LIAYSPWNFYHFSPQLPFPKIFQVWHGKTIRSEEQVIGKYFLLASLASITNRVAIGTE
jgi:hypothetical protein